MHAGVVLKSIISKCSALQVVIKGGQLLPIRSCIEAFIKGDDIALQSALAQSDPELQKTLAGIAVGLQQHTVASAHHVSHTGHSRLQLTADGTCPATHGASAGLEQGTSYGSSGQYSAKSYVADIELTPDSAGTSSEVVFVPPRAADVQRSAYDSASGQRLVSASQDAAVPPMHHSESDESQAGCDQLVQYVLRELLG